MGEAERRTPGGAEPAALRVGVKQQCQRYDANSAVPRPACFAARQVVEVRFERPQAPEQGVASEMADSVGWVHEAGASHPASVRR